MDGGKDRGWEAETCEKKQEKEKGQQRKEIKEKFMDVALLAMDMIVRVKNDFIIESKKKKKSGLVSQNNITGDWKTKKAIVSYQSAWWSHCPWTDICSGNNEENLT